MTDFPFRPWVVNVVPILDKLDAGGLRPSKDNETMSTLDKDWIKDVAAVLVTANQEIVSKIDKIMDLHKILPADVETKLSSIKKTGLSLISSFQAESPKLLDMVESTYKTAKEAVQFFVEAKTGNEDFNYSLRDLASFAPQALSTALSKIHPHATPVTRDSIVSWLHSHTGPTSLLEMVAKNVEQLKKVLENYLSGKR